MYVDKGPWYKPALERLGIPWEHETFGPRNPIEQWFGILKHRVKRFYVRWPHNGATPPSSGLPFCDALQLQEVLKLTSTTGEAEEAINYLSIFFISL